MMRTSTLIGCFVAERLYLAFLQKPQKLRLNVERQVADLVEEQRAAVGRADHSGRIGDRAGKRALSCNRTDALRPVPSARPCS